MKKCFVVILLLVVLGLNACAGSPQATTMPTEPPPSPSIGFSWEVRDGMAWLTGIGSVTDGDVVIPGQVRLTGNAEGWTEAADETSGNLYQVVVKSDAFVNCSQITSVFFMDGIKVEDDRLHGSRYGMFYGCEQLIAVYNIPDGVKSMRGSFVDCISLRAVTGIPDSVTDMCNCFKNCTSLQTISNLPTSVQYLDNCFENCTSLESVPDIPDGVTDMDLCFYQCASLVSAPDIPDLVKSLYKTFSQCTSLTTSPRISSSVVNMSGCFSGCSALMAVEMIPESVFDMTQTFQDCSSLTLVGDIPDSVVVMADCFSGCTSLVNAPKLGSNVQNVNNCFMGCTSLVTAPDLVSSIKSMDACFKDCTSLVSVGNLPAGIPYLNNCFENCTSLVSIGVIPEGVDRLMHCFVNCTSLKATPVLPDSVTQMQFTFSGCTSLETVTNFPANVINMEFCFSDCISLKTIPEFSDATRFIGLCFNNCSSLTGSITITENIAETLSYGSAFENCSDSLSLYIETCPFALGHFVNMDNPDWIPTIEHVKGNKCKHCGYSFEYVFVDGIYVGYENASDALVEWYIGMLDEEVPDYLKSFCNTLIFTDDFNGYVESEYVNTANGFAYTDDAYIRNTVSYSQMISTTFHELGHCMDAYYNINGLGISDLSDTEEWIQLHEKEGAVCSQWYNQRMYRSFDEKEKRLETFAISVDKYFTNPNSLKSKCPGMYEYMDNLFREALEAEAAEKAEADNAA